MINKIKEYVLTKIHNTLICDNKFKLERYDENGNYIPKDKREMYKIESKIIKKDNENKILIDNSIIKNDKNRICNSCNKVFLYPYLLKRHLNNTFSCSKIVITSDINNTVLENNNKSVDGDIVDKPINNIIKQKIYKCNECDAIFKHHQSRNNHIKYNRCRPKDLINKTIKDLTNNHAIDNN